MCLVNEIHMRLSHLLPYILRVCYCIVQLLQFREQLTKLTYKSLKCSRDHGVADAPLCLLPFDPAFSVKRFRLEKQRFI
ncbi:unnamed protein product [Closterium sp. NIES-65]|nr:unnamed protein product [Closterium sp. NIES-65]CAI5958979.1 unnamed protein product [Closterium sp. NIES-65]